MAGWSVSPLLFIDQIEKDFVELQKSIVMDFVNEVTAKTPIDSGNYMANNIVSIGAPDYSVNTTLDILGAATRGAARAALANLKPFSTVFVQNNSDYGSVIEFGGYNGPTIKVTATGFSRMSPKGVYGISFIAVSEKYR